ncbi:MAG: hypothetical protein VYE77_10925, partial [Planctomycetota bacterium]|nr:hypothetical protein [Planctomycetota bacterium]
MHCYPSPLPLLTACAVLWLGSSAVAQAPANDECSTATPLTLGTTIASDNINGSPGASDPAWTCGANITSDVWFRVTAASTCALNVTTCGSRGTLTDTVLEVFNGTSCPPTAGDLIICNDDGCGTGPQSAFSGNDYFCRETSSTATTGDTDNLNSPTYSTVSGPQGVQFALSRVGATIGTLEVRMADMN